MIARKILALPNVVLAGGSRERLNAWIARAVFYRSDQTKTLQVVATSGDVRGSRLPTHAVSGKPNVPITRVLLRTVKSGSPPGSGRSNGGKNVRLLHHNLFLGTNLNLRFTSIKLDRSTNLHFFPLQTR